MRKLIFSVLVVVGLSALIFWGTKTNLDRPIPVYQNGEIHAFETPDGRIESTDEQFGQLIKSYK